ncbi:Endopolyphosphatase [Coemansia sp. RSA 2675]|nr:Endopolyphosphatase [Coemansia sp. RSA 2675]
MLSTNSLGGDKGERRLNNTAVSRFIHITDLHVDPNYVTGATAYSQCHRRPSTAGHSDDSSLTGEFGRPNAKCDSPLSLINATSEYLRREWMGKVDFVMWTGDSGRHDNDAELPRTLDEIIEQNSIAARSMKYAFGATPIIPNVGNNDVSPHNELPGPGHKRARYTFQQLANAWDGLIPLDQISTFHYGGYFARDLGKKLTALSVNTMYWYRANAKVGGCKAKDSPGLAQLAWIRWQIRRARARGRDIIILGHVAPNLDNYRPTCYHGYARTVAQIVPPPGPDSPPLIHAQLFGHSNVDAWAFVGPDANWALPANNTVDTRLWWEKQVDEEDGQFGDLIHGIWSDQQTIQSIEDRDWALMEDDHSPVGPAVPGDFVETLLREYERVVMQTPRHPRLGITTISPSVIPKLLPAFRVFHYLKREDMAWRHLRPGTLLDYDVYTADLYRHNVERPEVGRFYERFYRFSEEYGIGDLSVDSVRRYDEEEDVEAPIPGLFDVPDFDSPEGTSQPRAPAAVARSPNAGGGANPVIDRRFPNEPMPAGMPSILAQIQDPSNESSLPAPPPSEPPADPNYPYYGPMVYSEAGMDAYRAANGLPPPPAGSTATYSVLPSAAERSQGGGAQQQEQAARQRAMAEHYYRLQAQQAQQMQAMQAMHSMPPIPMAHLAPMAHMPPMMAYPPMHQAMPPAMPQPQAMPQAPEPVAASNPRFGSPEEEEAWKQSNRMTTSSPPAYSAY